MTGFLMARWRNLLAGFWFVPGLVAAVIALCAVLLVYLDRRGGKRGAFEAGFQGDAEAARAILSTIAGSLITVAGLTFSLTVVVLTLVSSQFTPRALRGFLGDRVNQVLAGGFVGMFLYCLLVLRTVRDDGDGKAFVPSLSVTAAIFFGLLTLVLLLIFVHHMGQSIQASDITARIARQTLKAASSVHGEPYTSAEAEAAGEHSLPAGEPYRVLPEGPGYAQLVDAGDIEEQLPPGARALVTVRPGDFVSQRNPLMLLWGYRPDDDGLQSLRRAIPLHNERDQLQDMSYGMRQLTDIALKALSPGINDPTTASTCMGYLRTVLEHLADRALPVVVTHEGEQGELRLSQRGWDEYVDEAFSEIGRYGRDNARIVILLLESLTSIAGAVKDVGAYERLTVLRELGEAAAEAAIDAATSRRDREQLEDVRQRLRSETQDVALLA